MKKNKIRPTKLNPLGDKPVKDLSEMEEILHQFTIMREDMDAKIATVIEAVQISEAAMNRRMDGLEYKMDVLKEDMDTRFLLLSRKIDGVTGRVENHEGRITNLEAANT